MTDFRERLKKTVKKRYGNYSKFAEKVGIKQSYFSRILSGERTPGYAFFKKLADLDFDLNYLFRGNVQKDYILKEKDIPYVVDEKINKLQDLVYRIDNLFEELNRQEIDLNLPNVTIGTKQLSEFIDLLKELAYLVDGTLIENREMITRLFEPDQDNSEENIKEMKTQTTLLIDMLNEELEQRRQEKGNDNPN